MRTRLQTPSGSKIPIYCRRMVTILAESIPTKDEPTTGNGSGFVIWFNDKQWLVTAGHVVHALQRAHKANRLLSVSLCDAWSGEDGMGGPVVLPRDLLSTWIILGDEFSYDVAIMDLGSNLAAQLEAGHIEAVPEIEWRNPPANFDFYELVGTPGETLGSNEMKRGGPRGEDIRIPPTVYEVRRGVLKLEKIPPSPYATKTAHERFHGKEIKVSDAIKVKQIEGVSGGPILGCMKKADGNVIHHTIAVQSSWYPDKTIVANYLYLLPVMLKAKGF